MNRTVLAAILAVSLGAAADAAAPRPSAEKPKKSRPREGGDDLRGEWDRLREQGMRFLGAVRERWMSLPDEMREEFRRRAERIGGEVKDLLEDVRRSFTGGGDRRGPSREGERRFFFENDRDGGRPDGHPFLDRLRERMKEFHDRRSREGGDERGMRPDSKGPPPGGEDLRDRLRERMGKLDPETREKMMKRLQEMPEGERRGLVEKFLKGGPETAPGRGPEGMKLPPEAGRIADELRGQMKEMNEHMRRMMERIEKMEMRMKDGAGGEKKAPEKKTEGKKEEGAVPILLRGVV